MRGWGHEEVDEVLPGGTERVVRVVLEHPAGYAQWAAMVPVSSKLGCTAETLRKWVRRPEGEAGLRPGLELESEECSTVAKVPTV